MADLVIAEYEEIANVADAIRSKTGSTDTMTLSEMASNVMSISGTDITIDSALSETSTNPVQNKVVTKEIRQLSEEIGYYDMGVFGANRLTNNWVVGGLADGVFQPYITYRVVTAETLIFDRDITIHIESGRRFGVTIFNTDGGFKESRYWYNSMATIPKNTRFKIEISSTNETTEDETTVVATLETFISWITFDTEINDRLLNVETNLNAITNEDNNIVASDFKNGSINTSDGSGIFLGYITHRIAMQKSKKKSFDSVVQANDGFYVLVAFYENDSFINDSDWVKKASIPKNTDFRIMVKREVENSAETANIEEFFNALTFEHNIRSEINYCVKEVKKANESLIQLNKAVKPFTVMSIAHRGYNVDYPENTLHAFKMAKKKGFDVVEADIRFTSDNIPVIIHNATINEVARNYDGSELAEEIAVSDITYTELLNYDFGIWKGEEFAGTKIPTLDEFLQLCRNLSIIPLLDTYGVDTEEKALIIKESLEKYKLNNSVWICSSNYTALRILSKVISAFYGVVSWESEPNNSVKSIVSDLKDKNVPVFMSIDNSICNVDSYVEYCKENNLEIALYSLNNEADILSANTYAFAIVSDSLVAKDVLYQAYIE